MKNKAKVRRFKSKNFEHDFSSKKMTHFAGLSPIMKFIARSKLPAQLDQNFQTDCHNATKFTLTQLMLSVVLAAMCGVYRLTGIAKFTHDPLVQALLNLPKGINKDVISVRFKELGERGSRGLEELNGRRIQGHLEKLELSRLTVDCDSTVRTVYGNQQGAAKGYNGGKHGAKSYHPLLAFVSEAKLLANSWFRTGSAYTSNGIVEFIKQTACYLPKDVRIFFRADSGFFSGHLIDFLEKLGWNYLIKVKMKNLDKLLESKEWTSLNNHPGSSTCEFWYKCKDWSKRRRFKAIRTIVRYEEKEFFGKMELTPVYCYACYCTDLDGDAWSVYENYKQRSTCETWIEQVKSQLKAGMTLTDDFWANDILWQLCVLSYNLSIIMRRGHKTISRQEHRTFREWFIKVPAQVKGVSRAPILHIYKYYAQKKMWQTLAEQLAG